MYSTEKDVKIYDFIDDENLLIKTRVNECYYFQILNSISQQIKCSINAHKYDQVINTDKNRIVLWRWNSNCVEIFQFNGCEFVELNTIKFDFIPFYKQNSTETIDHSIKFYLANSCGQYTVSAFNESETYFQVNRYRFDNKIVKIYKVNAKDLEAIREYSEDKTLEALPPYCFTYSSNFLVYLSFLESNKCSTEEYICYENIYRISCVEVNKNEEATRSSQLIYFGYMESPFILRLNNYQDDFIIYISNLSYFYYYRFHELSLNQYRLVKTDYKIHNDNIKELSIINDQLITVIGFKHIFIFNVYTMNNIYIIPSIQPLHVYMNPTSKFLIISDIFSSNLRLNKIKDGIDAFKISIDYKLGSVWCNNKYLCLELNNNQLITFQIAI